MTRWVAVIGASIHSAFSPLATWQVAAAALGGDPATGLVGSREAIGFDATVDQSAGDQEPVLWAVAIEPRGLVDVAHEALT